ncbi:MAG: Wzz/FepE/Etk N-terminal domain-containing protein [Actinomycetia bacterium]|nr:Wzz/FepE/Etk N-terminal domain-containing protein [Actinomycetes bacterium]
MEIDVRDTFNLLDFLHYLVRTWWVAAIILPIAVAGGFTYTKLQVPMYKSEAVIIVASGAADSQPTTSVATTTTIDRGNYVEILKSQALINATVDKISMGVVTKDEVINNLDVVNIKDTEAISISVTTRSSEVSRKFVDQSIDVFASMVGRFYGASKLKIHIITPASQESTPSNISMGKNLAIALAAGMVLVLTVAYVRFDGVQAYGGRSRSTRSLSRAGAHQANRKITASSSENGRDRSDGGQPYLLDGQVDDPRHRSENPNMNTTVDLSPELQARAYANYRDRKRE